MGSFCVVVVFQWLEVRGLTELLCAGCVHDFEHYLSSLLRGEFVSFFCFAPMAFLRSRSNALLHVRSSTYIHVDRFAICILDRWVISFDEDSLDELR